MPPGKWRWAVCGLLLLATMLNYMDRQVFSSTFVDIESEFGLSNAQYGWLEAAFSLSFAVGGLVFGAWVDRGSLRWIYAGMVVVWSGAGVAAVAAGSFAGLLACRAWLGLAESAHWPCAIRTTQRILPARDRPLGNGLLQSGAALGGILTPVVIALLVGGERGAGWRLPFVAIGALGMVWAVAWVFLFRESRARAAALAAGPEAVDREPLQEGASPDRGPALARVLLDRRVWILAALSALFNATWQFLRAWLPKYLEQSRGYSHSETLAFTSLYFIAAGLGSVACGWFTRRLAARGLPLARARRVVMLACALLAALGFAVAFVPRGPLLEALLLLVGFGSLGIFPNFYSLTQEISARHQGKITGIMGLSCWCLVFILQPLAGRVIDVLGKDRGYAWNLSVGSFFPLLGMALLAGFWPRERDPAGRQLLDAPAAARE